MTNQEIAKLTLVFLFGMLGAVCMYVALQAKKENDKENRLKYLKKKLDEENQNFDFMEHPAVTSERNNRIKELVGFGLLKHDVYNPAKDQNRINKGLEENQFADPEKEQF